VAWAGDVEEEAAPVAVAAGAAVEQPCAVVEQQQVLPTAGAVEAPTWIPPMDQRSRQRRNAGTWWKPKTREQRWTTAPDDQEVEAAVVEMSC
jgi:hypothetical protein